MELAISESSKWATNFKAWLKRMFNAFVAARQAEANRRIAEMHLFKMSERELNDIGISRADIKRVVRDGNY